MKADVEFELIHDGKQWVVNSDHMQAAGETLNALDEDVRRVLLESGDFPQGARVRVFMGFDFDTFPTRLRQYHDHYFNRLVDVDL